MTGERVRLLFHFGDVPGMFVCAVTMQGRTNTQKKFKRVPGTVSIIAIESVRAAVDSELRAESDIEAVAV